MMTTTGQAQGPERRRKPRSTVAVPLTFYGRDRRVLLKARTVDMSVAGALVHGSGPVRIGQAVHVEVARGQARNPLTLQGEIVRIATPQEHRRQHGIAVRFVELSELDEALIESIITAAKG
ncbi:MAG: PilZ domain-containing protein [Deltaproteobacteria bacterium]|nr:PilZ domain-containing protein [Deltaproteobacteria bacterium]